MAVAPTVIDAEAGLRATVATGAGDGVPLTVMMAVAVFDSDVAVMVAVPAATPETIPAELTVATPLFDVDQVTMRSGSALSPASRAMALRIVEAPGAMVATVGVTTTLTTAAGGAMMVFVAVAVLVSEVAVIVTDPAARPVTTPTAFTVAFVTSELVNVTTRPLSTLPAASFVAAASVVVAPMAMDAEVGVSVTVAMGTMAFVTVTEALAVRSSDVAVMVAVPAATPVTTPVALTVAIAPLEVVHAMARSVSVTPPASLVTAASVVLAPTTIEAALGDTVMLATGRMGLTTVITADAVLVSEVAVMVAVPAPMPVTTPFALTDATLPLDVDQLTMRSESVLPPASFTTAASVVDAPTAMVAVPGVTATDATAAGVITLGPVGSVPLQLTPVRTTLPARRSHTEPRTMDRRDDRNDCGVMRALQMLV